MANRKISELTAKTTPELTDSTILVDGTGTKKTTLSAIRAVTQKISDLSAQVAPSLSNETVIDDSGVLKRTTLGVLRENFRTIRVNTITTATTLTPNIIDYDYIYVSALTSNISVAAPSSEGFDFQSITFRFLDNGTQRNITWASDYVGDTLPATTTVGKFTTVKFVYCAPTKTWNLSWQEQTPYLNLKIADKVFFGTGNEFRLEKGFETSPTAVDSLTNRNNDGLQNVSNGYINYVRSNNEDRRSYISSLSKHGKRSIKFIFTPYGGGETVYPGAQCERSAYVLNVMAPDIANLTYNPIEGSEYWMRSWMYFSAGSTFTPTDNAPKLMRLWLSADKNIEFILGGRVDHALYPGKMFISGQTQGFTGGAISLNSSRFSNARLWGGLPTDGSDWSVSGPQTEYPVGEWFHIEAYCKCSTDPATAMMMIWLNNTLVLARKGNRSSNSTNGGYGGTLQTLTANAGAPVHASPRVEIMSNWGTTGPTLSAPQYVLYDDIIATNQRSWVEAHGTTDADGYWMIGSTY